MDNNHKSILTASILAFSTLFALGLLFASGPQETEASSISGPTFGGGFNCVSSTYDIDFHFVCRDSNTNNLISCSWNIARQCNWDGTWWRNTFKPGWYSDRCNSGSGTGSTFDFCPGGCTMDWKVDVSKANYVSLASYYPGGDGSGKVCSLGNNCPLLYDLNGMVANWTVKLTPSCTHECSTIGATRCLNASTRQTCGNYDADSCLEWGNNTSCGTDVCSGENWVDYKCASNACTSTTTADCGAWTNDVCGGGACTNGQMRQTRTCTHNCGVESRCVASSNCGGRFLGRIYLDANVNGARDAGEDTVYQSAKICNGWPILQATVNYSGPSSGLVINNQCNPSPHYATGILKEGNYTVSAKAPDGWAVTTPPQSANLSGGIDRHIWFGVAQKPIAEASAAKTIAGPWADKVYITNVNPDVDKSKNWDFVLSALKDITGDGRASRDPKGGPITCTWAYDIDNVAGTTFTGCELGDGEYTDAKRQEMVDYYKAKVEGTYGAMLTVTDEYGLQDTDTVTIFKDPPPPPPKVDSLTIDDQCGKGADIGIPKNVITWSASGTTSYELKACVEDENGFFTICPVIDSGPFVKNPNTFTHIADDGVYYVYEIVVHGPGGDTSASTIIQARNCKGAISLTVYQVDDEGRMYYPIPNATVKLTNTTGETVFSTTFSDENGMAHFKSIIPGTYGVLAYKNKYNGIAKQAGDCEAAQYSTVNASIGPSLTTEWIKAAWDNDVPVMEGKTTWCHDLGLEGVPPLTAACLATPDPVEVNKPVTWTASVVGGERTDKTYSYSWTGDDGLSGTGKVVTKTYTTTGLKTAIITVTSEDKMTKETETSTEICAVGVNPPLVCDPTEFPKNQFQRCFYDYDFDASPSPSAISNGKLLSVERELVGSSFIEISSVVAIDHLWRGAILPSIRKSDNVGGIWQATINFKPEEFKFIIDTDDGAELTVDLDGDGSLADETPIINEWHKFDSEVEGHYETAGYYPLSGYRKVRLRWFESTGKAKIKLTWYNKRCHISENLQDKLHVCFYKGIIPGAGEFIGERTEAFFHSPAAIFHNPIDNQYGFGGESGIADDFSGVWRGIVNFTPGMYRFRIETNDGVRLDIDEDGIYEIDEWHDHEGIHETELTPVGGETPIRIEWYEKTGGAKLFFTWQKQISFNPFNALKRLFASLTSFFVI